MTPMLALCCAAYAADLDALFAGAGWSPLDEVATKEIGVVHLEVATLDGERCLRGTVTIEVPSQVVLDVVTDIPAAKVFSRETLLASRSLGTEGAATYYYQHLDVPDWTKVADRYWVLEGRRSDRDGALVFTWDRFDWRARYPDLATELGRAYPGAIEPNPNYGAWKFVPAGVGSVATYALCSDPGGSLPEWLVRLAATKTFPNTIVDVMMEGRRRAGG